MYSTSYWTPFIIAAIIINISPGPELIYVISRTISLGKKDGFFSSFGSGTGSFVHVLMVAFGLAHILSKSLIVFNIIKLLGAGYLIYLGVKAVISKKFQMEIIKKDSAKIYPAYNSYFKGLLVGLLNPKSIIFFLSFLPQFVKTDAGEFFEQIIMLGAITVIMGMIIGILVVLMINKIVNILFKDEMFSSFLDKIMRSILILLGIKLLLSTNKN